MNPNPPHKYCILGFFLVLVSVNFFVYSPSFYHMARGNDHCHYLVETSGITNLGELISRSYSYARTRKLMQGDKVLFRPLFYILWAFEKWLFGYDFFYWQVTGFLLHLIIQWRFFRLLNVFSFSRWSFLFVLLNSVWFLPQEMVIRHHLHGYLLFEIFALEACYRFFKYLHQDTFKQKNFWLMLGSLTLAYFFYEAAIVINLLFALWLYRSGKKSAAAQNRDLTKITAKHKQLLWLPVSVYMIFDLIDFVFQVKGFHYAVDGLTGCAHVNYFSCFCLLSDFMKVIRIGLEGIFLPAFLTFNIGELVRYRGLLLRMHTMLQALNIFVLGLGLVILLLIFLKFKKRDFSSEDADGGSHPRPGYFFLLVAMIYILSVSITRLQTTKQYLSYTLHHFHAIYLFTLAGVYHLMIPWLRNLPGRDYLLKSGTMLFLSSLIFLQAHGSFKLNMRLKELYNPQRIYIKALVDFVHAHKREPDFSFTVYKSQQSHTIELFWGDNREKDYLQGFLGFFLFHPYVDLSNPKYYLVYTEAEGIRSFRIKNDAREYVHAILSREGGWPAGVLY